MNKETLIKSEKGNKNIIKKTKKEYQKDKKKEIQLEKEKLNVPIVKSNFHMAV